MNTFWECLHHLYLTYKIQKKCTNDLESSRKSDIQLKACKLHSYQFQILPKQKQKFKAGIKLITFQIIILAAPTTAPSGHVWIPITKAWSGPLNIGDKARWKVLKIQLICSDKFSKISPKMFGFHQALAYWGACLPYCLNWGPKKHSAYQSAYPDLESVTQFGHANSHSRVRGCGCALSCNLMLTLLCIVIMYAFPQGYPSNWSLTFNLELYTSICEADWHW